MRVPIRGSADPRRWAADPENERRWEEVFSRLTALGKTDEAVSKALLELLMALSGVAHETDTEGFQSVTLLNTRLTWGTRVQTSTDPEGFTEWTTDITLPTPYEAAPTVQVSAVGVVPGADLNVMAYNVQAEAFGIRVTAAAAVTYAEVHFLVVGRV